MGASAAVALNPLDIAKDLGIEIIAMYGVCWLVGSTSDAILYCWDPLPSVRYARIWEGLAQCLLTRFGGVWTASDARAFANRLRLGLLNLH